MTPSQKANREKWVKALRSGKYEQGKDWLATGDKFCCLGVACELFIKENPDILQIDTSLGTDGIEHTIYGNANRALPFEIREWLGLETSVGGYKVDTACDSDHCDGNCNCRDWSLAEDNDAGKTFEEIARIIEEKEEEL